MVGSEIPSLQQCQEYATNPACAFPPEMVAEFYDRQCDRGWGQDWRARMRAATATYREMAFKRKTLKREKGVDVTKPTAPPKPTMSTEAIRKRIASVATQRDQAAEEGRETIGYELEIKKLQGKL